MNQSRKSTGLLVGLGIILPLTMIFSVGTGPVSIPALDIVSLFLERLGLLESSVPEQTKLIVESIRLPRTLLGVLVGGSLAIGAQPCRGSFEILWQTRALLVLPVVQH